MKDKNEKIKKMLRIIKFIGSLLIGLLLIIATIHSLITEGKLPELPNTIH